MLDVIRLAAFSNDAAGGNPAGVVFADTFPSDEAMRNIAREVGYSETAFLHPQPGGNDRAWRVRYFAPESEVPFCGHATIALAAALGERFGRGRFVLALNDAVIDVEAAPGTHDLWSAALTSPPTWSRSLPTYLGEEFLREFNLSADDLEDGFPPVLAHAGATHVVLALRDRGALKAMSYRLEPMKQLMRANQVVTVNLVVRDRDTQKIHSRNAFASGGVYEDPATGAAAAALGGLLRDLGKLTFKGGIAEFAVHQGDDMNVPSRITVRVGEKRGEPVRVSGSVRKIL